MYNTLRLIFQSFFCTIKIGGSVKSKFVKVLLVIILLFSLFFISFKHIENIKADSGWDSDYDSSWDSGSDWGSSSWDDDYDYDYDDDWDSDYSGSSGGSSSSGYGIFDMVIILTFFFFMGLSVYVSIKKILKRTKQVNRYVKNASMVNQYNHSINYKKLTVDEANKIIPNFDIEEFNFKAYQIFYDTQMAWMEFDYDKLKELLTDELYNSYIMDLDVLKVKNQKNTMKGFELIDSYIFDLKEVNDKYIAKVYLNVSFYDYVENINTGSILRGTSSRKLNNTYVLTFIKTKEEKSDINICPRCGASVEGNVSGICEYCKSKLINDTHGWVMSKKEKINQR